MPTLNKGDSKLSTNITLSKQDPSTIDKVDRVTRNATVNNYPTTLVVTKIQPEVGT
jgi:hypothetical protein